MQGLTRRTLALVPAVSLTGCGSDGGSSQAAA